MVQRAKGSTRGRRVDNTVRQLLLEEHRRNVGPSSRFHLPNARPSDYEQVLVAGQAVVVSSSILMCALMHAGLPFDEYAFGGQHFGKSFHLAEDGTLSEWTAADQAEFDRVRGGE